MAYWNHFAPLKYPLIKFIDLKVGDKFRRDFFEKSNSRYGTGKRRPSIVCIKTGELTYIEQRSKKEHAFLQVNDEIMVCSYL